MGSVDTSISDHVTIIVKAPNQQIADQTIQCHLNWTIKKLKDYLSEVYPSKPKMEEQKLIYSGKLLTDSAILKDVLRVYEGQENHTVHLVCTTKLQKMNKGINPNSVTSSRSDNIQINTSDSEQYRENLQTRITQHAIPNAGTVPLTTARPPFFDNFNPNTLTTSNFDPRYFWPSPTTFVNVNEVDANQQFVYMQQAYAQYISQYMQMMNQPGLGYMTSYMPESARPSQPPTIPNNNILPQDRNQAGDNQPAVGAVGNDNDEEEGRNNRDWLDWFYVFSRIVVLFSVVYFYSTPLRMLAVILLVCMFYLHQNMRLQNDQVNLNNNNNNVINHNNQNNENPVAENQNNENERRNTLNEVAPPVNNEETNRALLQTTSVRSESTIQPPPERLSPIAITLLAIRTFFLSLVPDHPVL